MAAMSDYLENNLVDFLMRAQAFTPPATVHVGLILATRGYASLIRSTAVIVGDTTIPGTPNGRLYRVTTAGTTGASEPTWGTTNGGTTADGTAVWTEHTPSLEANTNTNEPSTGAYARVSLTRSLANWAGTQAAGSTVASSGTSGTTSNNGVITFPAPSANWGLVYGMGTWDASTAGNLWIWGALTTPKNVNSGDSAPSFPAATLAITFA